MDGSVLHILDVGSGFQNGCFIRNIDAGITWRMMSRHWVDLYAGDPDYIHSEAGTNFASSTVKKSVAILGTIVRTAPTEAHDRNGLMEKSHAYFCTVYDEPRIDRPNIRKEDRPSVSFRANNDTSPSDTGIGPTTLVYVVYPKIPRAHDRGCMIERANIIRQCTTLATKMTHFHMLKGFMKIKHTPKMGELNEVRQLSPGHEVLVYRMKEG